MSDFQRISTVFPEGFEDWDIDKQADWLIDWIDRVKASKSANVPRGTNPEEQPK